MCRPSRKEVKSVGLTSKRVQKVYGGGAHEYDSTMERDWEPSTNREEIIEWLELKPGDKAIEFCVGTGLNLPYYPDGVHITGIDFTKGMLDQAREKVKTLKNNIELHEMDATNTPFEDNSFDAVLETYSLCVAPDPVKVIAEMKRVCKKNGRIVVFDCVQSESLWSKIKQYLIKPYGERFGIPRGVILWDPTRDLLRMLENAGLKVTKVKKLNEKDALYARKQIQCVKV
jgi:phosphatidylethanolamine/phosphatidyl-N-methylethanolamine N-methyltransferase